MKAFFLCICIFLASCQKSYLSIQQEWVDKTSLASSYTKTPDPEQKGFQNGKRLLISWDFPWSVYKQKLSLILKVRFWDQTEEMFCHEIMRKRGFTTLFFSENPNLLTYAIKIINENNEIVEEWEQQLWYEKIETNPS